MRKISRRSFLAASAAVAAAGALTACGGSSSTAASSTASSAAASSAAASETSGESYTVGICQLVEHDALDAATEGFQDALTDQIRRCSHL